MSPERLGLAVGCIAALLAGAERLGGQRESTAVVGIAVDLQTMNALVSTDYVTAGVQREVLFLPLVRYDRALRPVPGLAVRWDTAAVGRDSLDLTFQLRRDVAWHDGRPTTARDVLFTFTRAVDPATGFPNLAGFAHYAPAPRLEGPYRLRFRLRRHAEFLDVWAQLPILPEHLLGSVPAAQLRTHAFGTERPVGNGPFRFVRRTPGREWVFEANRSFPPSLGGPPRLNRLVLRVIPEPTTLLTELLTGAVDVSLRVPVSQAERLRSAPGVRLMAFPFRQWLYVAWNTRLPLFDTPEERRALTMALDRRGLAAGLGHGYAEVGRATVTPAHWAYQGADPRTFVAFDTAGARRLLAAAGWLDRDRDGVLEDARGRPFRFTLLSAGGASRDLAEVIQAQLRRVGVVAEPSVLEQGAMIRRLEGAAGAGGTRERDFEAAVGTWVDNVRKDDTNILHSRSIDRPLQFVGYRNPRVDALLDSLSVATDRGRARRLWAAYQVLIAQEAPYTVLFYPQRLVGVRTRLQGVEMDARGDFISVARWSVAPSTPRRP